MDKIYANSQDDHDTRAEDLEKQGYKKVSQKEDRAEQQTTYQNDKGDRKTLIG